MSFEDLDFEAVIIANPENPELCELKIRVEIPSRWPDMGGIEVIAKSHSWQVSGETDSDG